MSVTVTKTFASDAEAAAWLAGRPSQPANASGPAPAPKPAANAASAPTAASTSAAPAPAQTEEKPAAASLDFDKDVIEPMKAHFKKITREQAVAFLKDLGVAKPADLKDKGPEVWTKAIATMKA